MRGSFLVFIATNPRAQTNPDKLHRQFFNHKTLLHARQLIPRRTPIMTGASNFCPQKNTVPLRCCPLSALHTNSFCIQIRITFLRRVFVELYSCAMVVHFGCDSALLSASDEMRNATASLFLACAPLTSQGRAMAIGAYCV